MDMDINSVEKALQEKYSTNITAVYIPSLKREVNFRSIKVGEQKTLTKIMLEANGNQYKLYEAMLALIKATCLSEDFDVSQINELDRIKILIALYQGNFFMEDVSVKCEDCGHVNQLNLNFDQILGRLDHIHVDPIQVEIEDVTFTLKYPNVIRMGKYYKSVNGVVNTTNIYDVYDQFIDSFKFDNFDVDLSGMSHKDSSRLLSIIPQHILYGSNGVTAVITEKLFQVFDKLSDDYKCTKCEAGLSGGLTIQDFFI